jgi:hypothetical protein
MACGTLAGAPGKGMNAMHVRLDFGAVAGGGSCRADLDGVTQWAPFLLQLLEG